jgi:hypothetical protein
LTEPLVVERAAYRLEVAADGLRATLSAPGGAPFAWLRPLAAIDTVDARDETLAVAAPRRTDDAIVIERRSTLWEHAATELVPADDALEIRARVRGRGDLGDARLLVARSLVPGSPSGPLASGSSFRTLFTPNPVDTRPVRSTLERTVIGVAGDSEPGRHHWFFTPAPFSFAFAADETADDWTTISVVSPVNELRFVELAYEPADGGFHFHVDYDGHTRVDGDFTAPTLVVAPGAADPYDGLRRHRRDLVARGAAPPPTPRDEPAWWSEPMFCGWGAQCYLATLDGSSAADHATQATYDVFLDRLEREGVVPGTVVIDDKWQAAYGTNAPDPEKWPDLAAWIAARHDRGQRVLLWWKAWDPEGLPPELCVRNPDGEPLAVDPSNATTRAALRESITHLLSPEGLDADGLKVDFTARTPSGRALSHHGPAWGIALLHELQATVYRAAKDAKHDALVITHAPHPAFADVTDMIRLNDMIGDRAESVVAHMRYRADVARAACPELPIDTDDWRVPDLATWRAYVEEKIEIGVPALYYVSHVDATGEALTREDYETLRRTWAAWRAARTAVSA